jgi:hypothetical protein
MQNPSDGSTPKEKSRLIDQLEDAEQQATDTAEKAKMAQLTSQLRSAIVTAFVERPSDTDEAENKDET